MYINNVMKSFKEYLLEMKINNPALGLYSIDPSPNKTKSSTSMGMKHRRLLFDRLALLGVIPESENPHHVHQALTIAQSRMITGMHNSKRLRNMTVHERVQAADALSYYFVRHMAGTAEGLNVISDLHNEGEEVTPQNIVRRLSPPPSSRQVV